MRITVLKGGPSAEREVSEKSGAAVAAALRRAGHTVVEMDPTEETVRTLTAADQDVVFIVLHGPFGEDGTVQAILEEADVVYTGSDAAASRIAMDKVLAKTQFVQAHVFTPDSAVIRRDDVAAGRTAARLLGLPVVIKPACQGSTIGVGLIRTETDWEPALERAFAYGDTLLAEQFIDGRELTVGFLGNQALPVIEIRTPGKWYDYDAKYERDDTEYLVDAETGLPPGTLKAVQEMARRAFVALGCRDFGRVDLMLDVWQRPFVLEVNTIPGFTDHSLVPKAAAAAGIAFEDLCDTIANFALRRRGEQGAAA